MPRKKSAPKFKYTIRKKDKDGTPLDLYVRYPAKGAKSPVWRICRIETQEEVTRIIKEIKSEHERLLIDSAVPTDAIGFFKFWLETVKSRIALRTWQSYEQVVRLYLEPEFTGWQLGDIKPVHLQKLYREMSVKLNPQTIRKTHVCASSIFKEALNHEIVLSNPASRAKRPKFIASTKVKALNLPQVKRFLEVCNAHKYGLVFEFALETGMRPGEYLALRWSDIDFARRSVEVARALVTDVRGGGGYYFTDPKTKRSRRSIPISKNLTEKLREHLNQQNAFIAEIKERLHRRAKPSRELRKEFNKRVLQNASELNLVFPSQDFTPMKDMNLSRRYFKKIKEDADLPESFTLYGLRHTCCSLALTSGVNIKVISERLGHSSVAFTLDVYAHVLPGQQQEATDILSAVLYKVV